MTIQNKKQLIRTGLIASVLILCFCVGLMMGKFVWRMPPKPSDYTTTHNIPAERGEILDCKGNVIATNRTVYDVHLDCCVISNPDEWEEKSRLLSQELACLLPERSAPEWWTYLQKNRNQGRRYVPIAKDIDSTTMVRMMQLPLLDQGKYRGGRIISSKMVRIYPYEPLARRTIGIWRRYDQGHMFGLEGSYDTELRGKDGTRTVKHSVRRGRWRKWETDRDDKIDGQDIHTTIDMDLQAVADSLLMEAMTEGEDLAGGCLALMEVGTGEIKAIANSHRMDNGKVGEYFNYFIGHSYEPGAVVQTMTLAAVLSDGLITSLEEKIPTNKGRLHDSFCYYDDYIKAYERKYRTDSISVMNGFCMSSGYVAGDLALRYKDSADYYYDWLRSFCIGSSDFDIRGMRELDLPASTPGDDLTLMATGRGYGFTVSPVQILAFYNAIANGGKMMRPMLVKGTGKDMDRMQHIESVQIRERFIRPEVADSLKKALARCVEDGTAEALKGLPVKVAGKTGTSRQVMDPELRNGSTDPYQDAQGRRQYAGTFVGFYPADQPQYTLMCVLFTKPTHNMLYGGGKPALIAGELIENIEPLLQ